MIINPRLPIVEDIELFLNGLAPVFTLYFLFLLRRPYFHVNLRILLASFSIGQTILNLSRIVILLHERFKFLNSYGIVAVQSIHDACVFGFMDASALIAGERLVATCFVGKYEHFKKRWIAVTLCLAMWALNGTFAVASVILVEIEDKGGYHLPCVVMLSIMIILNCVGVTVFLILYRLNKRLWKRDLKRNLTFRYQIMENVRTSKQLLIVLLVDFIISLYFFFAINHRLVYQTYNWLDNIFSQIFDLICAFCGVLMPVLFIKAHPRLRLTAKKHFCGFRKTKIEKRSSRSVFIQPSQAAAQREANLYFSQLTASWDQAIRK